MVKRDGNMITYDKYVSFGGGRSILRESLPADHPENLWNYLIQEGIEDPSIYAVENPYEKQFEGWSRNDLIIKILELENLHKQ